MKAENHLSLQVAQYLNHQWPKIIYKFDTGAGQRMSIGMAVRNKKLNRWIGFPDLFLFESRGVLNGLAIELKTDGTKIFKKNNEYATPHIKEQAEMLEALRERGYSCHFGIGFNQCVEIINTYLNP